MQIHCKQCATQIPAEHINLERMLAKCPACHAVFSFAEEFPEARVHSSPVKPRDLPKPKRVEIGHRGSKLEIQRRWYHPIYWALAGFTLFWDGFMVVWFGIAFSQGEWTMAAFGTLHGAVGVGLTYWVLAGFLNTSLIRVDRLQLQVSHGPLPFPGVTLPRSQIRQLYCKEHVQRGKHGSRSHTYALYAVTHGGGQHKLTGNQQEPEAVWYLEQEIERFLNLEDQPMPQEYLG